MRRWVQVMVVSVLVCVAVGAAITLVMPRIFEARASLFVRQDTPSFRLPGDLGTLALPGQQTSSLDYALAILDSDEFARQILRSLRLASRREFTGGKQLTEQKLIERLRKSVRVTDGGTEGVIAIKASSTDPDLAARLANTFLDAFLERVNTESKRKSQFIRGKIRSLNNDLKRLEETLKDLSSRAEVINLSEQTRAAVQQAMSLQQQIHEATTELTAVESDLKNTGDLAELARLKARKQALEASRQEMQSALDRLRSEMKDVPAVALRQARLQREIDNKAKLYQVLSQQHELAQIQEQAETGVYKVLDRAVVPTSHARPKMLVNLAASFVAGLVVGFGVNLVISELRPT